jgi:ankyrin repeat protein
MELAELLISEGANVNAAGHQGWTPLASAAYSGYKDLAKLPYFSNLPVTLFYSDT